ncbi:MAG: hypothetical protein IJT98_10355 [Prevotella sp.]|nr:hypothetical protein [Prevotella sp.]
MKKIFLFSLALLTSMSFYSCKDNEEENASSVSAERLFRPMFRCENNTGKSTDPYNSVITDYNTANLYWYIVDDAVGYEIMWTTPVGFVSEGDEGWRKTMNNEENRQLFGHVVVADPSRYNLIIENLNYQSVYRFAIRALHSFDATGYPLWNGEAGVYDVLNSADAAWKNDTKNSEWYGWGTLREWADYWAMETSARDWVPFVIQVSEITKTSMKIRLNRNISSYADAQKEKFRGYWNFVDADSTMLKVDYFTIDASASTPNATIKGQSSYRIDIPESAWDENGVYEFVLDDLTENSCYNIDVWDKDIPESIDACYNTTMKRTKGTPAAPRLIEHTAWAADTVGEDPASWTIYDISQYNAMKLDQILDDYCASSESPENQVFYLEGGKAYFVSTNVQIYKGLTIQTNPADLAAGKGRAKFYLAGMYYNGASPRTCNFMLGRQPVAGENASITLDIDSIRFMDLDVDVPQATNYGHSQEGIAGAVGNYFMNMYSNGMGINVTTLEWHNCSFQGLIRGFFRIQGSNDFYIQHIRLIGCDFYNCGYYSQNGGDYAYIFGDHNGKTKSNILQDVEVAECVFFNNPKRSVVTDNNRNLMWDESVRWHINLHHNTFVNFCTVANTPIINTRYNPGGSLLEFHDNVIILTKNADDVNRGMGSSGWDTRNIQGGDGSGTCTFEIYNNWTTNDEEYLTNGQPFAANAFNATSNAPGKWIKSGEGIYPHGTDELTVHLDESLRATDLMVSPNPQHFIGETPNHLDYHTDNGIDGLYYQQTDKVLNSAIYKSGAGCTRLRLGK